MKRLLRSWRLTSLLTACVLVAGACGAAASAATAKAAHAVKATTVKVASVPLPLFAPLYVAMNNGYFKQQGINVQLTNIPNGQSATTLAANNTVQVVFGGFSAGMFNAVNQGLSFKVVGSMAEEAKGSAANGLVVAKSFESKVKTPAQLKGQKIAVAGAAGSAGSYLLALALAPYHVKLSQVHMVNLQFPEMESALENGAVAAAYMSTPFLGVALADHAGRLIAGAPVGVPATGVIYGGAFAKTPAAQRFFNALVKGAKQLQGRGATSTANLKIMAKVTGEKLAALKAQPPNLFDPKLAPPTATLAKMQRVFLESKALSYKKLLPASRYIDARFSKRAR